MSRADRPAGLMREKKAPRIHWGVLIALGLVQLCGGCTTGKQPAEDGRGFSAAASPVPASDAHSTRGLRILGYGVTMGRRGGVRKCEVLNTLSAEDFATSVRPA